MKAFLSFAAHADATQSWHPWLKRTRTLLHIWLSDCQPYISSLRRRNFGTLLPLSHCCCQTLSHQGKVKSHFITFVCGSTHNFTLICHVSQILDVRNVMVVVSRWYGGILLGPDRFKHINNCARNILVEEGYIASVVRPSLDLLHFAPPLWLQDASRYPACLMDWPGILLQLLLQ